LFAAVEPLVEGQGICDDITHFPTLGRRLDFQPLRAGRLEKNGLFLALPARKRRVRALRGWHRRALG